MTDLEKLELCFNDLGIKYEKIVEECQIARRHVNESIKKCNIIIKMDRGLGYADFFADFYFTESGKIIDYGVWE